MMKKGARWTVVDLFSGGGGMSYGFHANPLFRVVGAVDVQAGKPSSGKGSLECNHTYEANMGLRPLEIDLSQVSGSELRAAIDREYGIDSPTVLAACPPCTGFSRALPKNHLKDDPRNSLVAHSASFVEALRPNVFMMENARELIQGNFSHHFEQLAQDLRALGYRVHGEVHFLNEFGLAQQRERALVIAVDEDLVLHTLDDLWDGFVVLPGATSVRRAIGGLAPVEPGACQSEDELHQAPGFSTYQTRRRMELIPKDGGSWSDLKDHPEAEDILTKAMLRNIRAGRFGSHPDVYGRLRWDQPAVTIKRECAHVGNGRYAHPEQDRLCTVREMSLLQGFPSDYQFVSRSLSNMYRHIGDAVPPLISFQLSKVAEWILTGGKPEICDVILPGTNLTPDDIIVAERTPKQMDFLRDAG